MATPSLCGGSDEISGSSYGFTEAEIAESKLIRRLERLAREWPSRDYMIVSMGGTLCLFRSDDRFVDGGEGLDPEKALWQTDRIPNTGGDW